MSYSTKTLVAPSLFDPYENRDLGSGGTRNWEALIHLLKGAVGTGILAMPKAFTYTGWVTGLIMSGVISFMCCYGILVLARSQYLLCKRNEVTDISYSKSMREALTTGPSCLACLVPIAVPFVNFFLIFYQLGICAVYVIFIGTNLKSVIEEYEDITVDVRAYYMISFIPCVLLCLVRDLRRMAPFTTFANIVTVVGLGIIFYFVFQDFPPISSVHQRRPITTIPHFIGITLFALEAIGVIVTVKSKMIHPENFGGVFGVLAISFMIAGCLYAFVGLVGYVKYGEEVKATITLDLPQDSGLAQSTKILYSVAILISFGLQAYVPYDIIWVTYWEKKYGGTSRELTMDIVLRIGIAIIPFLMALAIPDLGNIIGLVGAFCLSMLGFVFPAVIEICVLHPDQHGVGYYMLLKNILLMLFGFFALFVGCTLSIIDIIHSYE